MIDRILIVDDEQDVAESLKQLLLSDSSNYQIDTSFNLSGAFRHIESKPAFDVIITDMRMPQTIRNVEIEGAEGLEVVKIAHKKDPLTQITVMTAYGEVDNVSKAYQYGATQYIDKNARNTEELYLATTRKSVAQVRRIRNLIKRLAEVDDPTVQEVIAGVNKDWIVKDLFAALAPSRELKVALYSLDAALKSSSYDPEGTRAAVFTVIERLDPVIEVIKDFEKDGEYSEP
jgi:DNA-binding NtrC family response regulator